MNKNPNAEMGGDSLDYFLVSVGQLSGYKRTPQPLQLTDRDKGEQCAYCGKDSWTCEHFEPPTHEEIEDARSEAMLDRAFDAEDAEEWQRRSESEGE